MSRITEFERQNRDLLENLKKRTMHGILAVTAISTGLSVTDSIEPSVLADYGVIALVAYIVLNVVWAIEQRHDLTPVEELTEGSKQVAGNSENSSSPREREREEA